jgi:hypothetical protein
MIAYKCDICDSYFENENHLRTRWFPYKNERNAGYDRRHTEFTLIVSLQARNEQIDHVCKDCMCNIIKEQIMMPWESE